MPPSTTVALQTDSPLATEELGRQIAGHLQRGDVVYLQGELGAGKTCFVRGLANGLDSADRVTSPTFVLLNQYRGRETLFHVDLYRTGGEGIEELGLWDHAESGVLAIEWADLAAGQLPAPALIISFEHSHALGGRTLRIEGPSDRGTAILSAAGLL
ncbi:MAG: tRNA (adenosine(37)-N6)-threonylcarbamoyltransferase complex ATPase subunit type 1 TsaE [Dehalococcoidia bacterium]